MKVADIPVPHGRNAAARISALNLRVVRGNVKVNTASVKGGAASVKGGAIGLPIRDTLLYHGSNMHVP